MIRPRVAIPLLAATAAIGVLAWQGARESMREETPAPLTADGWADVGAARLDAGDAAGAADAFRAAADGAPDEAAHWSALGEALTMQASGNRVPDGALAPFRRALALDGTDARARYFLALRRLGDGDAAGAIDDWLALLASMPAGTPWEADVVRAIERAGAQHRIAVASRVTEARARQPRPGRRIDPLALPPQ